AAAAIGDTARGVDQQAIIWRGDEAQPCARGAQPAQARLAVDAQEVAREERGDACSGKGNADVIERLADGCPLEVGFDAEHEGARLPIIAGLAAADESGALRSEAARERSAKKSAIDSSIRVENRRLTAAARPDAARIQTDVEPGPGERRRHEH